MAARDAWPKKLFCLGKLKKKTGLCGDVAEIAEPDNGS